MSDTDFRAVIDALSGTGAAQHRPTVEPVRRVAVLGAGAIGQLLACEALAAGLSVSLHSVYGKELDRLRSAGSITVRGAHLVGTYPVGTTVGSRPAIALSPSVDSAAEDADVVFVATPSWAQSTYASLLAATLTADQCVVLVPGRFLGSVAMRQQLLRHHCDGRVGVAELSAAPYLAGRDGATLQVHARSRRVELATLPVAGATMLAERLSPLLPMLEPVDSPLETAFATVTGIVSAAPVLANAAVLDAADGGTQLLKDLVTPTLSRTLLQALDTERRDVAFRYGIGDLPTSGGWLRAAYDERDQLERERSDEDLSVVLHELTAFDEVTVAGTGGPHLSDDVPNTLAPLASAGRAAGVPTPATDAVVALAGCLLGADQLATGRSLEQLGLADERPADIRRRLAHLTDPSTSTRTWWRL